MMRQLWLGACLAMAVSACAAPVSNSTPPLAAIAAIWDGQEAIVSASGDPTVPGFDLVEVGETYTPTLILNQSGSAISGTLTYPPSQDPLSRSVVYSISGTVSGQVFTFNFTNTSAACPGGGSGRLTVEQGNRRMSGSLSSRDCFGTSRSSFEANRRS